MPLLKEKKVLESFDCVKNIFIFYKLVLNALNKINKLVKFHYQIQILFIKNHISLLRLVLES